MSRYIRANGDYQIAYGKDHAFGLFVQVYDLSRANDEDEGLIVDEMGLTDEQVKSIAEDYGFIIE